MYRIIRRTNKTTPEENTTANKNLGNEDLKIRSRNTESDKIHAILAMNSNKEDSTNI